MVISEINDSTNLRNVKLAAGPLTYTGTERSAAELKHDLCSSLCVPETVELIQQYANDAFYTLKPQNELHCWYVEKIAVATCRIDRGERMERRVRDKAALRADLCWESDRRLEAIAWGEQLPFEPQKTVEKLRGTPQGCEWMMTRWAMLARLADDKEGWTPEQTTLAFNLLGTPRELRQDRKLGESLDFEGKLVGEVLDLAGVARREIAALKIQRELMGTLDEVNRTLARSDLSDDDNAELKRIRRHESVLHGRLRWYMAQLKYESPNRYPGRDLSSRWIAQREPQAAAPPAPEPKTKDEIAAENHPANSIHPPFDLEPGEFEGPEGMPDIPAILASRREKKLAKAESRREARRRKLDKLRA